MKPEGATVRMSLRHAEFLLLETFTGIRRNAFMSLAAVSTITVSLLLLGGLRLTIANLTQMAETLAGRFEMRVFLHTHLPTAQRDSLWKEISALPGVTGCRLVSKEEAWPQFRRRLQGAVDLTDLEGENPLPDSFVVRVADLTRMGAVADQIRRLRGVDDVLDTHEEAERVASLTRAVRAGGTLGVVLLVAVAAIIVGNTIRLTVYARRKEIGIMQLVGATNACVQTPFVLEGTLHGLVGALLALLLLGAGYTYLHDQIRQSLPFLELLPPSTSLVLSQSSILLGVGAGLGLLTSALSVHRYLRT
jgi:cell division transport system permease protein